MTTASSPFERRMSVAEFLAWSEDLADEIRYELVAGVPVRLMAPPTIRHARIQANVSAALRQALAAAGAPCQVFDGGLGVAVGLDDDECRIPDVVVTCATVIDETARLIPEPVVIVEVASPSTRLADVNDKVELYEHIPSVQHYLVLEQDQRRMVHYGRGQSGRLEPRIIREGSISLAPPGVDLLMEAFYRDTALETS